MDLSLHSLIVAASVSKTQVRRTRSIKYRKVFETNAVETLDVRDVIMEVGDQKVRKDATIVREQMRFFKERPQSLIEVDYQEDRYSVTPAQ
jgi:sporulation protein YlmC with PRC-barrel domain